MDRGDRDDDDDAPARFFLRCSFFCVAVFFALQFLLRWPGFLGFLGEGLGWFDAGWGRV